MAVQRRKRNGLSFTNEEWSSEVERASTHCASPAKPALVTGTAHTVQLMLTLPRLWTMSSAGTLTESDHSSGPFLCCLGSSVEGSNTPRDLLQQPAHFSIAWHRELRLHILRQAEGAPGVLQGDSTACWVLLGWCWARGDTQMWSMSKLPTSWLELNQQEAALCCSCSQEGPDNLLCRAA